MSTNYVGAKPTTAALTVVPVSVASSGDTVDGSDIVNGAVLVIQTGGTGCTATFTDPGHTPAGTAAGSVTGITIGTNTTKVIGSAYMAGFVDPSTNKATVAFSATSGITAFVVL